MLTVITVTVIITLIVTYISSSAVLKGTKENVQSRMEIANQHINSVLVGVEVAVASTIPEVEKTLSEPDEMYNVVRRLLELNPNHGNHHHHADFRHGCIHAGFVRPRRRRHLHQSG